MFDASMLVLQETEAYLVNILRRKKEHWNVFTRYLIFPLKFLMLGIRDLFKPFVIWSSIAFVAMFIAMIVLKKLNAAPDISIFVMSACMYGAMIIMIFSVPSTYSSNGVNTKSINFVVNAIEEKGIDTTEKVKLFEENIARIYKRISSRVIFYKWFIGALWAIYLISFNFKLKFSSSDDVAYMTQLFLESRESFTYAIFSAMVALILVVSYKRASEILIKNIEYAGVHIKSKLLGFKSSN